MNSIWQLTILVSIVVSETSCLYLDLWCIEAGFSQSYLLQCPEGSWISRIHNHEKKKITAYCKNEINEEYTSVLEFDSVRGIRETQPHFVDPTHTFESTCKIGSIHGFEAQIMVIGDAIFSNSETLHSRIARTIQNGRPIRSVRAICDPRLPYSSNGTRGHCGRARLHGFRISYRAVLLHSRVVNLTSSNLHYQQKVCQFERIPGDSFYERLTIAPICGPEPKNFSCNATDHLVEVSSCNNVLSLQTNRICTYTQRIGTSKSITESTGGQSATQDSTSSQNSWSFSFEVAPPIYVKAGLSRSFATTLGRSVSTGFNWNTASQDTWNHETTAQASYNVPPGQIAKVFQVVGACGPITVKTASFTFVDYDGQGNEIVNG